MKIESFEIEFSGWLTIDPDNIFFVHAETFVPISGTEYLKLTEEQKGDYFLDSLAKCIDRADDLSFEQIDITNDTIEVNDA